MKDDFDGLEFTAQGGISGEGDGEDYLLSGVFGQNFHDASDHYPFLLEGVITGGVEAVRKTRSGRGYGHTWYDTLDKVDQTNVRDAASLAVRLALRIASEDEWPASPREVDTVTKLLQKPERVELYKHRQRIVEYFERL